MTTLDPTELAQIIVSFVGGFKNMMNLNEDGGNWIFRIVNSTGNPTEPKITIPIRDSPILLALNVGSNIVNKQSLLDLLHQNKIEVENHCTSENQYFVANYRNQPVGVHSVLQE